MPRVALGLAYDGEPWQGWQTQPGGLTVQDALEAALAQFLAHATPTICAGRTDTGVHALCQVVHVDTEAQRSSEDRKSTRLNSSHVKISYAVFCLKKKIKKKKRKR